jgi:guanine nucleotide-binding protein G(i) subunit alpha
MLPEFLSIHVCASQHILWLDTFCLRSELWRQMADPITLFGTILGTAGAVTKLVDFIYQITAYLYELHGQWKEADFTLFNLISQLTALRAGLDKIHEWMSSDTFEPHHQLVMDLEISISCCRMLITKLNTHIVDLRENSKNSLDFKSKMSFVLKSGILDDLQKMLERQTIALTLLLTACNW